MVSVGCMNEGGEHYFPSMRDAIRFARYSQDVCTLYDNFNGDRVIGTYSPLSGLCLMAQVHRPFSDWGVQ